MIWIATLLIFNLTAAGFVTRVLMRQRSALARLQIEIGRMIAETETAPARAGVAPEGPGERIIIHILNPLQLAAKQSRFADRFGTLTPSLVRRFVYQRAAAMVRQQLIENGAEAEVTVRRAV